MKLTSEEVREKILSANPCEINVWIQIIMKWQTEDEIVDRSTKHENGIGLNGCDAGKISYYYDLVKQGLRLTDEQVEDARKRLLKYSKQYSRNTA